MGGGASGHVAARMAVDLVVDKFMGAEVMRRDSPPSGAALERLVDAVQHANAGVHGAACNAPAFQGMGTTLAALLTCGNRAALAHVGDSRIYRLRGNHLTQLTEDDSLFNDYVRAGRIHPDRAGAFQYHHVITRAIGSGPTVEVDARIVDVMPGDTFLLCSDGLYGVVRHQHLMEILTEHLDLNEAVGHLIEHANEQGGPDNITAVLVRCEATGAAAHACA
jgi:protein phosphatase